MPLPHADTVRELRRRHGEAQRALMNQQQVQVLLTTLSLLSRTPDLRLDPLNVPGGDIVEILCKEWPALHGLTDSDPKPGDSLAVAVSKRSMQMQLAARFLDTVVSSAHGSDLQLRQLLAEQQLALEAPEMADLAEELRRLGEERNSLHMKTVAMLTRHGSIEPVDRIYKTLLARVDAELAAAARGVHYADWKALTMMRALCEALDTALAATGHGALKAPPPPELSPSPLPIDLEARRRTEATRAEMVKLHESIGAEVADIERQLAELKAQMDTVLARITAETG